MGKTTSKAMTPTTLDRWWSPWCVGLWSSHALPRATSTPLAAQSHVRKRARTHLASRKNKFYIKAHLWVNWGKYQIALEIRCLREFSMEMLTCSIHQMLCFSLNIGICLLCLGGCRKTWCFPIFLNEIKEIKIHISLYRWLVDRWIDYKK